MKRKRIIDTLLILFVLIPILIFSLHKATYRKEAIKYLEDKYNESFSVSLTYKTDRTELGDFYCWKATSTANPDRQFTVSRGEYLLNDQENPEETSLKVYLNDSYEDDMFEYDILDYYENIINSHWKNVIPKFSPTSSPNKTYSDATDYLQNETCSIRLYIKYDKNFDYDVEAEKIHTIMKNEMANNHPINLSVCYVSSRNYRKISKNKIDYISEDLGYKEYYECNLYFGKVPTKENIIEDMKKTKAQL